MTRTSITFLFLEMLAIFNMRYKLYDNFGITVSIPQYLKLRTMKSGFFATTADDKSTMTVEVDPVEANWLASRALVLQPLGKDPWNRMESRIVREGPIVRPYPGYERIVEHFMKATGETDFGWMVNCESGSTRIILEVGAFCPFAEQEDLWTKVLESLRIKPS